MLATSPTPSLRAQAAENPGVGQLKEDQVAKFRALADRLCTKTA